MMTPDEALDHIESISEDVHRILHEDCLYPVPFVQVIVQEDCDRFRFSEFLDKSRSALRQMESMHLRVQRDGRNVDRTMFVSIPTVNVTSRDTLNVKTHRTFMPKSYAKVDKFIGIDDLVYYNFNLLRRKPNELN
jgi:hypothetical protein